MKWYRFETEWVEVGNRGEEEKVVKVFDEEGTYLSRGVAETYDPDYGFQEVVSPILKEYGYYNRMGKC